MDRAARSRFIWSMAKEFVRHGVRDGREALALAGETYRAFLIQERVYFGHPDYDWSPRAGGEVAHHMEIDQWEPSQ